jgi:hypothetical protein
LLYGFGDTVAKMILDQAKGDGLEGAGNGRHLGEDVDAVRVGLHHPLQAADLPLDPAQPFEVGILLLRVPVHTSTVSGHGTLTKCAIRPLTTT